MKFVLAALFACGCVSLAEAVEWPPAEDYLNPVASCSVSDDVGNCEYTRTVWGQQYANAIEGNYQGQRNVSFCLSTGCSAAIVENRVLGCAWRHVIIASGHLELDQTDATNLKHFCGPDMLDDAGREAAQAQSKTLLRMLGTVQ
ncbi:hypothetical protein AM571_CH03307 [Rhizobium etli 8C-3]|uniref:Uncharacterized protein n=1 Tax=Rhizobium etli 8C-3 TaxID=538025 RepID=A0A1L5P7J3_RHIET|nr:hypothetical protein [Rhizobium etli]APO76101.1 hypothetical protein AM571_CH03307 [Rhizobium etli 8C-3]